MQPGGAPHRAAVAVGCTTDAAGLVARQSPEPVVAEDQVPDRVVTRAADVRAVSSRSEGDCEHPPTGTRDDSAECGEQLKDAALEGGPRVNQVDQAEAGNDEE